MNRRRARRLAAAMLGLSLALLLALIWLGFPSMVFLAGAAAAGSGTFLVITRAAPRGTQRGVVTRRSAKLLTSTVFFLFSGLGLLTLVSAPYQKPLTYYVFISVAAAALAGQIGLIDTRREVHATLGQVFLLALSLFASTQLAFPLGIGGADARVHIRHLIVPILQTGYIPSDPTGFAYQSFPGHHLLVVVASQVLRIDPSTAYYVFGFLAMSIPILVVFLICRRLLGTSAGLVGALLLSGSSYYIFWASHAAPLSFAIPVVSALMLLILIRMDHPGAGFVIAAGILMASVVLTHPYSSVILGIVLLGLTIFLGSTAAKGVVRTQGRQRVWGARGLTLLFFAILLAHWIYYSSFLTRSVELASDYYAVLVQEQLLSPPAVYDTLPLSIIFLNTLGDSLLISVAVIGFFFVVSRGISMRWAIVIGPAILLLVVLLVGTLTSLPYLLPNRIYVFLLMLGLVPLAAVGLSLTILRSPGSRSSRKRRRIALLSVLVGLLVFWSSASTIAGFETSPFVSDQAYVKLYDTEYDRSSVTWVCRHLGASATIQVSPSITALSINQLYGCFSEHPNATMRIPVTLDSRVDIQALQRDSFVLFSDNDVILGFQSGLTGRGSYGQGIYQRLDGDAGTRLSTFSKIYDNGATAVFAVHA